MADLVARADVDLDAPAAEVWAALTTPAVIAEYFFGSRVDTDWQPGSPITWSGEFEGNRYQDKGQIVEVDPPRRLQVTHFSPLTGLADVPENYHTITYVLEASGNRTHVALSQDHNADEAERDRAAQTWTAMLVGLKKTVEGRPAGASDGPAPAER